MRINSFFVVFLGIVTLLSCSDPIPEIKTYNHRIHINQIGYYPNSAKHIMISDSTQLASFSIVDIDNNKVVFEGRFSTPEYVALADESIQIGDFSAFDKKGKYSIYSKGIGFSYPFEIKENVLKDALIGSIKGLYYQRASMPLMKDHAGKWSRKKGHPDDRVRYHSSTGKDTTLVVASSGGWYDAGDYNKYVINGAFPMGQYLQLYEQYPQVIKDDELNIPESNNGISDYLDELKYELDWLLTMQDDDGGLFHKLTTKNFEPMIMPHEAKSPRFIVGKGTAATLNFAAALSQAYRVYKKIDSSYANRCLKAALLAWDWAKNNPDTAFKNPKDVHTGEYGDTHFDDEFIWASAELYISTGDPSFLEAFDKYPLNFNFVSGESWTTYMRFLGFFSLLNHPKQVPTELYTKLKHGVLQSADKIVANVTPKHYLQPITKFTWGSNSDVLNGAMIVAQAYRLAPKSDYLEAIQEMVSYIFGKNPVGYSYLTGYGGRTPMNIHHRQSASDDVEEPVPGLLSGGPSDQQLDKSNGVKYPENVAPMKSWVDQEASYVTNEICLNWNAPLTYILGFLEKESN